MQNVAIAALAALVVWYVVVAYLIYVFVIIPTRYDEDA